jgi:CheY-like chemotaxis protein
MLWNRRLDWLEELAMGELNGIHALLVDDDPDARQALVSVLECLGARATEACSAADARLVLRYVRPDVIVSDLCMPGETGFQFISGIRHEEQQRGGHVPAVAISAFFTASDRDAAFRAGFEAFLMKPFEIDELAAVVSTVVGSARDAQGVLAQVRPAARSHA